MALLVAAALFSMFFFISLYMQQVLGYDALKAGLAYLPLAGGIIVSAGLASQLVTRIGFKPVFVGGLVLTAAGLAWFSQVASHGAYVADILFPSLLAAVGLGFAFVSMTIAAVAGVEPAAGRTRLRADQHVAADRRRARAGDPGVGRDEQDGQRDDRRRRRSVGAAERPHRGLPGGVHGRHRLRGRSARSWPPC